MTFDYIRRNYGVPAARGVRVLYTGGREQRYGTITSVSLGSALVNVRLDGDRKSRPYHPTWELEYNSAEPAKVHGAGNE